ncbi:hypothetical protein WN55_02482 [Dufourea novaeangliae]|uniref:Uncharacterized protein n=1 Tax=Dufourea novaeangliae TaxID=178035 RepID=A0A154PGY3_DUFNO|nr:hypothetical protein WN55_02482 [Dufourea novaeangliae]
MARTSFRAEIDRANRNAREESRKRKGKARLELPRVCSVRPNLSGIEIQSWRGVL